MEGNSLRRGRIGEDEEEERVEIGLGLGLVGKIMEWEAS